MGRSLNIESRPHYFTEVLWKTAGDYQVIRLAIHRDVDSLNIGDIA